MMKFAMLASGSRGNCFLLQDENTFLMIDCGTTKKYLSEAFSASGFSREDLDAVLITHTHTDHISCLRMFEDYPIYAAADLGEVPYTRLKPMEKFALEHLTILPLPLSHDAQDTVGYVIESWQEKLVYITDTGYVKDSYLPLLKGADYIILESNHDVEMLMQTRRPQYLKMRIASDSGHLCNEDCAAILDQIVTERTKQIILAHISREANTRERALEVNRQVLEYHPNRNPNLLLCAAGQYEVIRGGAWKDEEMDPGSCSCIIDLEHLSDRINQKSI